MSEALLTDACKKGNLEEVQSILKLKPSLLNSGKSLLFACKEKQSKIVSYLLQFKFDVNKEVKDDVYPYPSKTPLMIATQLNYTEGVKLLAGHPTFKVNFSNQVRFIAVRLSFFECCFHHHQLSGLCFIM
jgi:ankyrin repeat protein